MKRSNKSINNFFPFAKLLSLSLSLCVSTAHVELLLSGSQENHCEMRVSLNQKPNSSKDFGFEAAWDSTGARVTSVQKGN